MVRRGTVCSPTGTAPKRIATLRFGKIVKAVLTNIWAMETGYFKPELVAPCGMNCGVCKLYLAFSRGVPKEKGKVSHCNGCGPRAKNCYIKRGCKKLRTNQLQYCYECAGMPCKNLEHLESRYQERYATSLVGKLLELKEKGME